MLIASPTKASVHFWDTVTRFRVNKVPGAVTYCWTFDGRHGVRTCESSAVFDLWAAPFGVGPGPVTVTADAVDGTGAVVMSETITFELLVSDILEKPQDGQDFETDDDIRLRSAYIPTATDYCWLLFQDGVSSGQFCDRDGRVRLDPDSLYRRGLEPGAVGVRALVYRRNTLIGRQTITIELVED